MNIKIAKIDSSMVSDIYFMGQSEFDALADDSLVLANANTEIGDIYDSESSSLTSSRIHGVPKGTSDVPPLPNSRYDGETFTYNVTTNGWDSDAMIELREERDRLLKDSDFSQAADFPESDYKTAMTSYRQVLRDLPEDWFSNPIDVVYPETPSTIQ